MQIATFFSVKSGRIAIDGRDDRNYQCLPFCEWCGGNEQQGILKNLESGWLHTQGLLLVGGISVIFSGGENLIRDNTRTGAKGHPVLSAAAWPEVACCTGLFLMARAAILRKKDQREHAKEETTELADDQVWQHIAKHHKSDLFVNSFSTILKARPRYLVSLSSSLK